MSGTDFVKAQSDNLPNVDAFMLMEFIRTNECFNAAEIRGIKAEMSMRSSYVSTAIGYVQLKRVNNQCTVQCQICPEHRVKCKNYKVIMVVNEEEEVIEEVKCLDCAASEGGCKHALAFLMWVHTKSTQPAPTTVECYWKKPKLSGVGTTIPYITTSAFGEVKMFDSTDTFLREVIEKGNKSGANCQILKHFDSLRSEPSDISLHKLLHRFIKSGKNTYKDFLKFSEEQMTDNLCKIVLKETELQSESSLWFELRYGRLTASKIYHAACSKKVEGSFVNSVVGAHKITQTAAMKRGSILEDEVRKVVQKKIGKKIHKVGLFLDRHYPELGASPDGIVDDFVVEIKCPSSEKTYNQYILKTGGVSAKCYAQIQVQMFLAKKKKCLFCVADPHFEENKNVNILKVEFDNLYTNDVMSKARQFWEKAIFNVLLEAVC